MSDYSKTVDFAAKDALPSGNANKLVKGAEINSEFVAVQTAVNSKADSTGDTFTGNVTFNDNVKAKFGNDGDLEIYHDGSGSYIKDAGTGILKYTSNVSTTTGTILEIENTNTSAGTGAYVKFIGSLSASNAKAPTIGTSGDKLVILSNEKIVALLGSTSAGYNSLQMYNNANGAGGSIMTGSGTPEGAVSATVGSLFMRTDGGTGTSLYVKESGTGNTGWVAK